MRSSEASSACGSASASGGAGLRLRKKPVAISCDGIKTFHGPRRKYLRSGMLPPITFEHEQKLRLQGVQKPKGLPAFIYCRISRGARRCRREIQLGWQGRGWSSEPQLVRHHGPILCQILHGKLNPEWSPSSVVTLRVHPDDGKGATRSDDVSVRVGGHHSELDDDASFVLLMGR